MADKNDEQKFSSTEINDTVIHGGREWPAGTKLSEITPSLDEEQKERLKRIGRVGNPDD